MGTGKPIYGMNKGSVGFLMNDFREDGLPARLEAAHRSVVHPPSMSAWDTAGQTHTARAINDVYMLRQTYQAAKLSISIDGNVRLSELIADGVLIATPAGSTAYNLSANGPILPLNAPLLALTPISAFRPRRWRGALLPDHARIRSTCWRRRTGPSTPSPTILNSSCEPGRGRPWTAASTSSCCTIPATASTSGSCASNSETETREKEAAHGSFE